MERDHGGASQTVRSGVGVLMATLSAKVVDMAKNIVAVSRLGVTSQADVYNVVVTLPDFIVIVVGLDTVRGVATTYFTEDLAKGDTEHLRQTLSSLVSWGLVASLTLGALSVVFMQAIVGALAPGFPADRFAFAVSLGYVMIPALVMRGVVGLFQAALNAYGIFVRLSWLPGVISLVVLGALLLSPSEQLARNATFAYAAGYSAYAIALALMVRARVPWTLRFRDFPPSFFAILRMSGALVLSMAIAQVALMVEKRAASFFPEGTIASLGYGSALAGQLVFLVVLSLFPVMQRRLTELVVRGDGSAAANEFWMMLSSLLFAMSFFAAVLIASGDTVLTVLYRRQAFDAEALHRTAGPLMVYALWMLGQTVSLSATTFLLAMKRSRAILFCSLIAYGLEIAFIHAYVTYWGSLGVAIGALTATGVYAATLLAGLRLAAGPTLPMRSGLWKLTRILVAGAVAGGAMSLLQVFPAISTLGSVLRLCIVVTGGLAVFIGVASVARVNYARPLLSRMRIPGS